MELQGSCILITVTTKIWKKTDNTNCLTFAESILEERELTDAQFLRLSKKITNEFDLTTLAVLGLGMDESAVSGYIANKEDIKMAAFHSILS